MKKMYLVGHKVCLFFSVRWLLSLTSFKTILLIYIVTAVISACILKKKQTFLLAACLFISFLIFLIMKK